MRRASVRHVPVADVGIVAFATRLAIGPEAEQVVVFRMLSGARVLVFVAPGVLAHVLQVATWTPVADGRVRWLGDEGGKSLLGGRILRVVQPEHGQRRLQSLDVLLRLRDARV